MNMEIWRAKHKQLFQMTEQKQLIFQIWLLTIGLNKWNYLFGTAREVKLIHLSDEIPGQNAEYIELAGSKPEL